jgi:hypothetical protein
VFNEYTEIPRGTSYEYFWGCHTQTVANFMKVDKISHKLIKIHIKV